ncbi:MAG: YdiU family protein [Uliginosibacterium sp.]|nr:YdiU family protein [Uliginosibacterium sp.]
MTSAAILHRLSTLRLERASLLELPVDPLDEARPRQVYGAVVSRVKPSPVSAPALLAYSGELAASLGLHVDDVADADAMAQVFAGNRLLPGSEPFSTCYGGHQFGQWAGQLGDGRAISLGVLKDRQGVWQELQLKGAGRTAYSRHADGRAVLRSSLREYLCSEAMHHLGVPTTRALCLVATGEAVARDMFYDGRSRAEPGAVVTRVAPSFLRFGHYEIFAARGELDVLRQLVDHTLCMHYPSLGKPSRDTYLAWFAEVCRRTAHLVAEWWRVGFVHGVMNTDNLSILGLTIDYGPYGWLDGFDLGFTPNTTDSGGRYSFGNQAQIAGWNLSCLAQALLPLVQDVPALEAALDEYRTSFELAFLHVVRSKLGLADTGEPEADIARFSALVACFSSVETDMTLFFRLLGQVAQASPGVEAALTMLNPAFYATPSVWARAGWADWLAGWLQAISAPDAGRVARMNAANPWIIPRNWLAQTAIHAAEQGDTSTLTRLMAAIRNPYADDPAFAEFAQRRPDWARNAPGCSALSCSS